MGEATASYNGKKTLEKNNFFSNINTTDITHNKTFWKTVKPFFADKIKTKSKITLIEKKIVSQEDQAVAEVFNNFFINIVPNLKISTDNIVMIIISSPLMTKLQTLSISLGIIQVSL